MSVLFNIRKKDGTIYEMRSMCYGVLKRFPIEAPHLRSFHRGERPDLYTLTDLHSKDISHIEHVISEDVISESTDFGIDVFKELKRVFDDCPMFSGTVRVMPERQVVRVAADKNPADKVLMALFMAREISSSLSLRDTGFNLVKRMYNMPNVRPRNWILGSLFCSPYSTDDSPKNVSPKDLGESSFFNPKTFGITALEAFCNQTEEYQPWFQPPFSEGGYMREDGFRSEDVIFNELAPECFTEEHFNWEDDEYYDQPYFDSQKTHYRNLIDCFSVPADTPICPLFKNNEWMELILSCIEWSFKDFKTFVKDLESYNG